MKIDKAGHYKTVDGRKVLVSIDYSEIRGTVIGDSGHGLIYTSLGQRYNKDGSVYDMVKGEELDAIIAEWTDTPEVGTLQEIGARVGDVVKDENHFSEQGYFTVLSIINHGSFIGAHQMESERYGRGVFTDGDSNGWRIIYRAQPKPEQTGPVRTVTRTTREIVPGVYGTLQVHACGDYTINESTADELTAAIAALTSIRDALKENG